MNSKITPRTAISSLQLSFFRLSPGQLLGKLSLAVFTMKPDVAYQIPPHALNAQLRLEKVIDTHCVISPQTCLASLA
jgi:hypothetical protein